MAFADYYNLARAVLPAWFTSQDRPEEMIRAFAMMFQYLEGYIDFVLGDQTKITKAVGASGQPDWLNLHALDRGTRRQSGELDSDLQDRLQRVVPSGVTRIALLADAQAAATAAGLGAVYLTELKYDAAYFVDRGAQSGTGGTFTLGTGTAAFFEPTAGFVAPLDSNGVVDSHKMIFSGSASAGNDGTFPVTGIVNDTLQYTNASAVAEVDAAVAWTIAPFDSLDNQLNGFADSYLGRGFRLGASQPTVVVMLPYPCTESLRVSVLEAQRLIKAAGVQVLVECRAVP